MLIRVPKDSDQWHELRWGRITCSRLGDVMAGHWTKRYKTYQQTIMNAMQGYPTPEISLEWHEVGKRLEPIGIALYEKLMDVVIDQDIFFVHDDYEWLAGTPDGLVDDKIIEVKTRHTWDTFEKACFGRLTGDYLAQIQGQLLVSKALACDYVNLFVSPDGEPVIDVKTILPDRSYQEALENACADFYMCCAQFVQELSQ